MQKPILALIVLSIFLLPNSSQAGVKDISARAKIAVKWPNHEQWKCRKLASYSTKDFFKGRSIRFLGKHFAPSIIKKFIPKHHTIVFAELVGRGGKSGSTHYGPGYSTRYNIFIVTAEVPNTEYFWTRESRMNYGHGHGYIAFRGAPLFVEAKRMITQIPYMADIGQTYNDVKDCTLWIRVLPLTSKLYEADPPTAKEKKVRAGSSRCLWLEQAKKAAGESKERVRKRSNSEPITQTQAKHSDSKSITQTQAKHKEVPAIAVKPLPSSLSPGDVITNSIGMKLVYIPAGEFMMGSPSLEREDKRDDDEGPQHRVKLSKGFYMGRTEVTQAQYKAIMGSNPSHFKGDNLPVEQVSYDEATEFCEKLSRKEGWSYRLPTEAEWEYACRAGTQTPFYFGKELTKNNANFVRIWLNKTEPVGSYTPNTFGLYDMHGNVVEWCSDRYDKNYYSKSPSVDPEGPNTGSNRVLRGGGWDSHPSGCRSANRQGITPGWRTVQSGFRIIFN